MSRNYDDTFKINSNAMKYCFVYPYLEKRTKTLFTSFYVGLFYGVHVSYAFLIAYSTFASLKMKDYSRTAQESTFMAVWILASFQYCVITWKKTSVAELIRLVNVDYEDMQNLDENERTVVMNYVKKGVTVTRQCLFVSSYACGFYLLRNIFNYVRNFINGDNKLVPFYPLNYPPLFDPYKDGFAFYIITYYIIVDFCVFSTMMYTVFVPLGSIFMLHTCGQLEIITMRMQKLFENRNEEEVMLELRTIIRRLQNIYRFADITKNCFRLAYEFTLKATTFILPITFFELVGSISRGQVSIEFVTFILGSILISSYPCYYSELLMEKGERFRLAVYSCGWERYYYRRTRSTIALILQRSLRPIAMESLFRTINLDALADLFHQAYAIFSLMNAMWEY